MTAWAVALLTGLVLTFAAQAVIPPARVKGTRRRTMMRGEPPIAHGLWVGLLVSTLLLDAVQGGLPGAAELNFGEGPPLRALVIAGLPVMVLALISDRRRPGSERHAAGLLLSGLLMTLLGYSIFVISSPGGTVAVPWLWQAFLTVVWLFLLASIVELVSLVPLGVTLLTLALSGVVIFSGGLDQSIASSALAGVIPGAILGRALANMARGWTCRYGRTEIFVLGVWMTAMTNTSFMKSVALAGFVLPLGALAVGIILITLRGFERSLLLRDAPRADQSPET